MNKMATVSYFGKTFLKKYFSFHSIRPAFCSIKITERCNFKCVMCDTYVNKKEELTTEQWKRFIRELAQLRYLSVRFTGGEPLLRRDILEVIEEAIIHDLRVVIATNGYLLNKKIAHSLHDLGVSGITISLNGLRQDHDQICGVKGAFGKIEKNLDVLIGLGMPVTIAVTLMQETLDKFLEILEFAEKKGLRVAINLIDDRLYFLKASCKEKRTVVDRRKVKNLVNLLKSKKKENPSLISVSLSGIGFIRKYFEDPVQKKIPCISSIVETLIDSTGNVYGGCFALPPINNIQRKSLAEILLSESYKKRSLKTYQKHCPGCACGYDLNMVFMPNYILREIISDFRFLFHRIS